jgi:glycyl-tRNA synthetase beta chain
LPPSSQKNMAEYLANNLQQALTDNKFVAPNENLIIYSTPRRLGLTISNVLSKSPDEIVEVKLMPINVGWQDDHASQPLLKKLEALDLLELKDSLTNFIIQDDTLYAKKQNKGQTVETFMQHQLPIILKQLPIEKTMSYQLDDGWQTVSFARPAVNLVCMHGDKILDINVLGLQANNQVHGHRFASKETLTIKNAEDYEKLIESQGNVVPNFEKRKQLIRLQIEELTKNLGSSFSCPIDEDLLDEVTTLVEKPKAFIGTFDQKFLTIPSECLILSMKSNQKYFPILKNHKLTNQFILISNIDPKEPKFIIQGNEKVIYPRLSDAEFFYAQDKKKSLQEMSLDLKNIIYHQKLGSIEQRCEKVSLVFNHLIKHTSLNSDADSKKLALFAKADLSSLMVGEFPELQGVMGKYYGLEEKLSSEFCQAIEDHYKPKFSGDELPQGDTSILLALSDKWISLFDLFSIGEKPSGVKDPYALRRSAISIIRILIDKNIDLNIHQLIDTFFPEDKKDHKLSLFNFFYDRLENYIREQGYETLVVQSVCEQKPALINDVINKIEAIEQFKQFELSNNLAQSNKRVLNILKKYEKKLDGNINESLFENKSEHALFKTIQSISKQNKSFLDKKNYKSLLENLIHLSGPIDDFFEDTMINAEDIKIKHNRHQLLAELNKSMNIIANLSVLGT